MLAFTFLLSACGFCYGCASHQSTRPGLPQDRFTILLASCGYVSLLLFIIALSAMAMSMSVYMRARRAARSQSRQQGPAAP